MRNQWKDSYRLGDATIDRQHQELFALAAALLEAPDQAARRLAAMHLYKHVREHFADEEALMQRVQFPRYQEHVNSHNRILHNLNAISKDIGNDTVDPMVVQVFLEDWGLKHIPIEDAQLTAYMEQSHHG
jgi:hemerythrin-like metal-binding protein